MIGSPGGALADVLTRLCALDVAAWRGLPHGLTWHGGPDDDVPAAAALGDAFEPADMVHVSVPSSEVTARLWLREDVVVLVDVAPDDEAAELPEQLGEPDRRLDTRYGLRALPHGEWVYAARGLALVVDDERVRHVIGFAPCAVDTYVSRLRVRLGAERHPLAAGGTEDGL
jgi:hypothetical protein